MAEPDKIIRGVGEEHVGITAEQYMAEHPDVDWSTHEVLFEIVNAGSMVVDGKMITKVAGHWKKPDYAAIQDALDKADAENPGWDKVEGDGGDD